MEKTHFGNGFVLAIAPVSRGIGYALVENAEVLVDWGTRDVHLPWNPAEKNRRSLKFVADLFELHRPATIAIADWEDKRRSARIRGLLRAIAGAAAGNRIGVAVYSRADVAQVFEGQGALLAHDMARVAARLFPELAPRPPKRRRVWDGEQYRMSVFAAAMLGIAHFASAKPLWLPSG